MSEEYGGPCLNTDRELWRERPGDYYADSIHVTEGGGIGINCGGYVIVMPVRTWFALAKAAYDEIPKRQGDVIKLSAAQPQGDTDE